jgi:hypothetical protein
MTNGEMGYNHGHKAKKNDKTSLLPMSIGELQKSDSNLNANKSITKTAHSQIFG